MMKANKKKRNEIWWQQWKKTQLIYLKKEKEISTKMMRKNLKKEIKKSENENDKIKDS